MLITVAICTWNRAELLDQTLTQIRQLRIPDGVEWELLVINNNCTDHTDGVVGRFATVLPLRLIHETTPGLSAARNRAITEAKGEWLFYTDDDVLVHPELLTAYSEAIDQHGDTVSFMGGPIEPWFPQPPEPAMAEAIPSVARGFCGIDVFEQKRICSTADGLPMGANMLYAVRDLRPFRFDPNLGVNGTSRIAGEEQELMMRLLASGKQGVWVKQACVKHYVSPERLTLSYLRRHFFDLGRTAVRVNGTPPGRMVLGSPAWLWKDVVMFGAKCVWNWLRGDRYHFYHAFARFFLRAGMLREAVFR